MQQSKRTMCSCCPPAEACRQPAPPAARLCYSGFSLDAYSPPCSANSMATIAQLVAALEALPQHFGVLSPSVHATLRAVEAAELLGDLVPSVRPADVSSAWDTTIERCVAMSALL